MHRHSYNGNMLFSGQYPIDVYFPIIGTISALPFMPTQCGGGHTACRSLTNEPIQFLVVDYAWQSPPELIVHTTGWDVDDGTGLAHTHTFRRLKVTDSEELMADSSEPDACGGLGWYYTGVGPQATVVEEELYAISGVTANGNYGHDHALSMYSLGPMGPGEGYVTSVGTCEKGHLSCVVETIGFLGTTEFLIHNELIDSGYSGNGTFGQEGDEETSFDVETLEATDVADYSAQLNATVFGDFTVEARFSWDTKAYYDAESDFRNSTNVQMISPGSYHDHISPPILGVEYAFRAEITYIGETKYGEVLYFTNGINAGDCSITTLPPEAYWWIGGGMGTIKGLFEHTGTGSFYVHLGFEYSTIYADLDGTHIHWLYTFGNEYAIPRDPTQYAFKTVLNNLLPDRTYFYRACCHIGRPPMNVNNIFGSILSFGGPQSVLGQGYDHVTAKKAEDDISKTAVGRYYMDKSGLFVYESAKHRDV